VTGQLTRSIYREDCKYVSQGCSLQKSVLHREKWERPSTCLWESGRLVHRVGPTCLLCSLLPSLSQPVPCFLSDCLLPPSFLSQTISLPLPQIQGPHEHHRGRGQVPGSHWHSVRPRVLTARASDDPNSGGGRRTGRRGHVEARGVRGPYAPYVMPVSIGGEYIQKRIVLSDLVGVPRLWVCTRQYT